MGMKMYISAAAVFPVLLLMLFADGMAAANEKAKSIDELAAMYDSESCKDCHAEIYKDWEKSLHSKSIFGTGRTAATLRTTVTVGLMDWAYSGVKKPEDVQVKHLMICMKCHLPQLADATDEVAKEIVRNVFDFIEGDDPAREKAEKNLNKISINCLICHNRNAIIHKWVDGFPQKGEVYGSKSGSHPAPGHPLLKKSPVMSESILCGQCHGLGPNFELENPSQCGTLYGSYLWAYRAEGGQESCQDCHMKKSGLGHNMQTYRDPKISKAALDFRVETLGYQWRDGTRMVPQTLLQVEMKNKAGHAIPDG